jgi:hypothetical protein
VTVERVATKFSRKDQENRLKSIKNKLKAKKFGDITLAIIGDSIKVTSQKPIDDDTIKPTPPGRGDIPPGQVDKVAAEILGVSDDDDEVHGLQLDIYPANATIGDFDHTRGGRKIYGNGYQCTTSFSVRQKSTGRTGILSAGHCGATMNRYDAEDSGIYNTAESDYAIYHKGTHMGYYGDFAWYTNNHFNLPQYWASPYSMRRVTGWDWYPSVNEWVCVYSRMQKRRTCTQVYSIGVYADYRSLGYPAVNNLVATTTDPTIGGDSGGPWSFNTIAYGVTSGGKILGGKWRATYSEMFWLQFPFNMDIELLCDGPCVKHYT